MRSDSFMDSPRINRSRRIVRALCLFALIAAAFASARAHPLGNFTVNHFARLEVGTTRVRVHFVVDMAEIPTYQELQTIDTNGDGKPSQAELDLYAARSARDYAEGLTLTVDETRVPLTLTAERISLPAGAGNLPTLRLECDYEAALPIGASGAWQMRFADSNHQNRTGWYEIVIAPAAGVQVFNSTASGGASLSDELRAYPTDRLTAPLDERTAQLSFTTGALPASARPLLTRDGRKVEPPARDRLAELIAVTSAAWPAHGTLVNRPRDLADAPATDSSATVDTATVVAAMRGTERRIPFNSLPSTAPARN